MIDFSDILSFVDKFVPDEKENQVGSRRPLVMASNLVKSKHLFDLRIQEKTTEFGVFCLCLSGKDPCGKPHEIRIIIKKDSREIRATCTCIAGIEGQCKHTVAGLMKLERMNREDVEGATCTDLPQKWGKSGKTVHHLLHAVPVEQFCHLPKRKRQSIWSHEDKITLEMLNTVKQLMFEGSTICPLKRLWLNECPERIQVPRRVLEPPPMPVFLVEKLCRSQYFKSYHDKILDNLTRDDLCEFFFTHVYALPVDVDRIYRNTTHQNNSTWKKERQIRITGTTAYKYKTERHVADWDKKCSGIVFNTFRENSATRWGIKREKPALRCFIQRYPECEVLMYVGLCVNANVPMLACSPDGIMNQETLLEVKCPTAGKKFEGDDLCNQLKYLKKEDATY